MRREDVRVAVLFLEGTNCEDESADCLRFLGAQAEKVHLKQLTGEASPEFRRRLSDYNMLVIPGGFANGDYVRAGAIFAARIKSKLRREVEDFVRSGRPVLGLCNGFQVLVEAGLLPGLGGPMTDTPEAVLATNESAHYECRPSFLKHENGGSCAFTRTLTKGDIRVFVSAHGEGKFLLPKEREKDMLKDLIDNDQVVFRYVDDHGRYAGYPWCPNGALYNIAAICNREGNVFGVQPHPERAFFRYLNSDWTRSGDPDAAGDGRAIFESALDYVSAKF